MTDENDVLKNCVSRSNFTEKNFPVFKFTNVQPFLTWSQFHSKLTFIGNVL